VRLVDGGQHEIVWPINELSASSVLGADMDVVLLIGTEPQLKWRTFCSEVLEVVTELNARMLITLGALLAEVPHSRPVSVIGTAADPTLIEQHGLQRSRYEGPTGIVGALHDACNTAGLPSLSLWAAVPAYVQGAPSPKAALALVERVGDVLDLMIPTTALEIASAAYEREVDEVVTNDDELSGYVRRLEDMVDSGEPFGDDDEDEAISADDTVDELVEELERFLRDQQGD
jgi:proteasome assembly chaperone (PAC2) family protein